MLKAFCDSCSAPIASTDSHLSVPQIGVIYKDSAMEGRGLHFCHGKTCINKWLDKALEPPPTIIAPPNGFRGPNG